MKSPTVMVVLFNSPHIHYVSIYFLATNLCIPSVIPISLVSQRTADIATLVVLFLHQFFFSFATISFVCFGISYLDDNVKSADSAGYIGKWKSGC